MKKCPKCDLNWIQDYEVSCWLCGGVPQQNPNAFKESDRNVDFIL